jgi:alkylation response protein AidB-like acyl-CoA dehydrogenase
MAVTAPGAGRKGITAFLVERDSPGVRPGQPMHKLGCRSSDTSGVVFEQARVPATHVLGAVDAGFRDAMIALNRGRTMGGALSVGIAQAALDEALRYANERVSMGQRLNQHQVIQFKLADMALQVEAARLLVWRAAALLDAGREPRREAAMAKLFASETAVRAADQALQIHGGYGYVSEFAIERIYRDARVCTIGEGTSEIMRMVIARDMLRDTP